jgi:hypothetical protein
VTVQDRQQFIVFDVPKASSDVGLAKKTEVGEQLTEPDLRRQGPHLGQDR